MISQLRLLLELTVILDKMVNLHTLLMWLEILQDGHALRHARQLVTDRIVVADQSQQTEVQRSKMTKLSMSMGELRSVVVIPSKPIVMCRYKTRLLLLSTSTLSLRMCSQ
jgi:hypothetical protein